ncbi:hypothetical protein HK096_006491 [Nowakowskiella sp. JEL0078]|nr:hypothetical protein HK096_006491 [Nowakowskiella sp. JEL0078]
METIITDPRISISAYKGEEQLPAIIALIQNDLSEPYSVYTYRYFLVNWPQHCYLAHASLDENLNEDDERIHLPEVLIHPEGRCVGVIICRLEPHHGSDILRGYIAMLAVAKPYRKRKIGVSLVRKACLNMKENNADEIVLETEYTNLAALSLYERLGFIRDKLLGRYYLNGVDAFRLKLYLK